MAQSMVSICVSMVLEIGVLNDAKIKAAKPREKPYRLGDSGQLYLQVTPSGGKHWRMNYTFGKNAASKPVQKTLSFGSYPITTLLEARAKRDEAKRLLGQGSDPALERRVAEQARIVARQNTFQAAGEAWFELNSGWSLDKLREWAGQNSGKWSHAHADNWTVDPNGRWSTIHARDVIVSLDRDVFPVIGEEPIASLQAPAVLTLLRAVQNRGSLETAHRLRQRISAIFVYGIGQLYSFNEPRWPNPRMSARFGSRLLANWPGMTGLSQTTSFRHVSPAMNGWRLSTNSRAPGMSAMLAGAVVPIVIEGTGGSRPD